MIDHSGKCERTTGESETSRLHSGYDRAHRPPGVPCHPAVDSINNEAAFSNLSTQPPIPNPSRIRRRPALLVEKRRFRGYRSVIPAARAVRASGPAATARMTVPHRHFPIPGSPATHQANPRLAVEE